MSMKVVFLVASMMHGGVERTVTYISEYFAKKGIETYIITVSDYVFYQIDESVRVVKLGIEQGYGSQIEKYIKIWKRLLRIRNTINGIKPDVIFCMAPIMAKYLMMSGISGKYKIISSERNNPMFDTKEEIELKKKIFKRCKGIIFQTERAKACFDKEIQEKGIVIPNAVGNPIAYEIHVTDKPQKKFSAIGRLSKQKDYPTMLEAFSSFSRKYPEYKLEIFGDKGDREKLQELAEELNIYNKIKFCEPNPRALEMISDSTAFILSSIYEGMPNVLMEAMGIGLPCISTDCPFGPRELINDTYNGYLVPVGNSEALCEKMLYIVENYDEAKACGLRAREILNTNSIETISKRYYDYVVDIASS